MQDQETTRVKTIEVYVCPTDGCGQYYGSANMPDLSERFTGPNIVEKPAFAKTTGSEFRRSQVDCPDCFDRGLGRVPRVRIAINVPVPIKGPDPTPLPPAPSHLR